jgi:hypothetical protein
MRVYGRVLNPYPPSGVESSDSINPGAYIWQVIETDAHGSNDYVHITALIQCLRLNLNESPFWGNFGIPAKNSVDQQTQPDYYIARIQSYFSQFFASLIISKQPQPPNNPKPIYNVRTLLNNGTIFRFKVGI